MFSPEQNYFFLFAMRCTNRSSSRKKTEINKEINYGGPGSMPRINFDDICPRPQQNSAPSETKLHPRNKGMRPHQKPNSTRDEGMQPHQKPNSTRNKDMRPHWKPNSTRDKGIATIKQQREEAHQKRLQEEENYRLACLRLEEERQLAR